MKIKLKNVKANPFRNIKHYPIRKDKVEALRESYRATGGVWPNIVARPANGGVEIAYGHHRTAAAEKEYGPDHQIEVIDRKLDDSTMLKMMAHDNMEEYGTSAIVIMETVKSVVEAFAEGKIELKPFTPGPGKRRTDIRIAPSFQRTQDFETTISKAYSPLSVAEFLGWIGKSEDGDRADLRVRVALNALELIEKRVLKESNFYDLSLTEASALVAETNETLKWRERSENPKVKAQAEVKAREVGTAIAKTFRTQKESGSARDRATRVVDKIEKRPKELPNVKQFVREVNKDLFNFLRADQELTNQIHAILQVIEDVDKHSREQLYQELLALSGRAKALANMVKTGKSVNKTEFRQLLYRS